MKIANSLQILLSSQEYLIIERGRADTSQADASAHKTLDSPSTIRPYLHFPPLGKKKGNHF